MFLNVPLAPEILPSGPHGPIEDGTEWTFASKQDEEKRIVNEEVESAVDCLLEKLDNKIRKKNRILPRQGSCFCTLEVFSDKPENSDKVTSLGIRTATSGGDSSRTKPRDDFSTSDSSHRSSTNPKSL
ncbi:hypothetical protein P7K49_025961 [Saguinus oedipus]|uniref:Uncharacterized protein n=1 Tax=Saguinus oedipus TaxID=9490 RepID=A0ABQ9UIP3_SAGOE|nr:hypothetical protein P7K49_025961 [Saguinus oedipus]